jgi:hypothetical protein
MSAMPYVRNMTAHVNEQGIVLRFNPAANLTHDEWEKLLDELRSHHIPGFYQHGKRAYVDISPQGQTRVVIYFTTNTVTMDEAIAILKNWAIEVHDVREEAAG